MTDKIIATTRENIKEIIQLEIKVNGNNCDLNHIDVSQITDMSYMFYQSQFNGDISNWNVSQVTDMTSMFLTSIFNGDISEWDVSKVSNMRGMFYESQFNGDISNWNVSNVKNMINMFANSKFNEDIRKWNVSKVKNMYCMFANSKFNGDLTKWLPYNLLDDEDAFKNCTPPRPYWANFDNVIDRNDAINKYLLYCNLDSKLHIKGKFTKKHDYAELLFH